MIPRTSRIAVIEAPSGTDTGERLNGVTRSTDVVPHLAAGARRHLAAGRASPRGEEEQVPRSILGVAIVGLVVWGAGLGAQETASDYQGPAAEAFLKEARIARVAWIGEGVTRPRRVWLEQGGLAHSAVFKSIDVRSMGVTHFPDGTSDTNFQDSWQTEIAAYRVDRLIGLGMVPATVERRVDGDVGSLQRWITSEMAEADRVERGLQPPDAEAWSRETQKARFFDQLIANADRHQRNLLITKAFELRLIDHSRAFRTERALRDPDGLRRFSRSLLDGIRRLTRDGLRDEVGRYLTNGQIDRLLERRDALLALAQARVAAHGEAAVMFP